MLQHLPIELQAYILHYLPSQTLVRTLSLTNHHFHSLIEAHVQRYCLRYLELCSSSSFDNSQKAVLEFEAQRPIDTVTAKHTLHFSHFATVTPCYINAKKVTPLSSAAIFEFSAGSSNRVITDAERLLPRGSRGGRARGSSVSVGPERRSARGDVYISTPFQPYLPGLSRDDQHRATQAFVSSSLDLDERVPSRPTLSRNPSSASSRRSTSRSSSTSRGNGPRAIAAEIANAAPPFPFLREAAAQNSMHRPMTTTTTTTNNNNNTEPQSTQTQQSLEHPLDAYDWAPPPGYSRQTPISFGGNSSCSNNHRRKPACYAFQLDPLDSFESLILTLTVRRSVPDVSATIAAILRGEDVAAGGHRLRFSKILAEGLDRVFRDWFKPPSTPSATDLNIASTSTCSSRFELKSSDEPEERVLELDLHSCSATMTIQPHASNQAHIAHPALSWSASHDYLSRPSLSAQYASLESNERVQLTFHCEKITINAARLLATLERLEHDILAQNAKGKISLSSSSNNRLPRIIQNVTSTTAIATAAGASR